jgi:glycopeptide antibiotics resistance protein
VKTFRPTSVSLRRAPGSGTYALFAAAFLAFVIYGSLVPLHYRPLPCTETVDRFHAVCARPVRVDSISDWTTNIVLFIPLGFLLMAMICVDRRAWVGWAAALLVLPFCTLLSASLEFTQLWFPPRISSLNDVVAESLGGVLGVLLWLTAGGRITAWLRQTWASLATHGWAARALPAYLALLFLIQTLPLDLTIRPADLYHKYCAGLIQLIPFASGWSDPWTMLGKHVGNMLYFLPVGLLLAQLPGSIWRGKRHWPRVLAVGAGLAALVEFLQLFVESRHCDASDVITGALAVLGGWAASLAWSRNRAGFAVRALDGRRLLLLVWLGVLVVVNWQPFDFSFDLAFGQRRFREMSLVPFADYQRTATVHALDQLLHKVLLWVPLGALLAVPAWRAGGVNPPVGGSTGGITAPARQGPLVLAAFAVAICLEAGQLFLPTRYASVTDVLLETVGAWIGVTAMRRLSSGPSAVARTFLSVRDVSSQPFSAAGEGA